MCIYWHCIHGHVVQDQQPLVPFQVTWRKSSVRPSLGSTSRRPLFCGRRTTVACLRWRATKWHPISDNLYLYSTTSTSPVSQFWPFRRIKPAFYINKKGATTTVNNTHIQIHTNNNYCDWTLSCGAAVTRRTPCRATSPPPWLFPRSRSLTYTPPSTVSPTTMWNAYRTNSPSSLQVRGDHLFYDTTYDIYTERERKHLLILLSNPYSGSLTGLVVRFICISILLLLTIIAMKYFTVDLVLFSRRFPRFTRSYSGEYNTMFKVSSRGVKYVLEVFKLCCLFQRCNIHTYIHQIA